LGIQGPGVLFEPHIGFEIGLIHSPELIGHRWGIGWMHLNGHAEFTGALSAIDASRWWNIFVVSANTDHDVTVGCSDVVGGVEADPSVAWEVGFRPGV